MRAIPGIVALALLVGACQQPAELKVEDAWVRLPAVAGRPGAAYFTIQGGDTPDTLLAVATRAALRVELHETSDQNGLKAMRPIRDVAIPAAGTVAFAPGGKHVMLFDLGPNVKAGERIPLALSFAGGKRLEVQAMVVGAGEMPPK
ncbi:copper chaperone PCu(A)C [Sphingomonas sp. M1-B02]|uniref:copper chaperone PCu(A)C n=1 Tax=Sphingomonas sp. M1-B02 TaxID=3114300 RepID=UPI002240BFA4|nr:copper chaperone PCu(A)C [Sphingomonas sp. S6-11]UZK65977.1 copper chaperone PCu(A)C [Sphingomonas sp. S6-11]